MINVYQSQPAKIIAINQESADTKLFRLRFIDKKRQKDFNFLPGQFVQIGLAGWGECPISFCSSPDQALNFFELAIRAVGSLTNKLHQLRSGDLVEIRGPFGNGFDEEVFRDRPLTLIGGGCGFVPLRPLIVDYLNGRLAASQLQVFYGCLSEDSLLFRREYAAWNRESEFNVILEKPSKKWAGARGLVTKLLDQRPLAKGAVAVLVGPPVMYRFVIKKLLAKKIKPEDIYLSLERKMYCGVGVCQHCAIGPYYVCRDGPVFRWSDLAAIKDAI